MDSLGSNVELSYKANWPVYACNWSLRHGHPFRLALGSFRKDYQNKMEIIQLNDTYPVFRNVWSFDHPYPATKIMWSPSQRGKDLLASTSDFLRIYELNESKGYNNGSLLSTLDPRGRVKNSDAYSAPLTSFDWNEVNASRIATSSVDTTCAIWDIEAGRSVIQLIAHDREVYDVAFASQSTDIFASVGADGSCRMFDQRTLQNSTIVYETPELTKLIRLAWNKQSHPTYIALVEDGSNVTTLIDVRVPSKAAVRLARHSAPVNSIAWAPHSSSLLCTVADDGQALIWDTTEMPSLLTDPWLSYGTHAPVNHVQWSVRHPNWISIVVDDALQLLKV